MMDCGGSTAMTRPYASRTSSCQPHLPYPTHKDPEYALDVALAPLNLPPATPARIRSCPVVVTASSNRAMTVQEYFGAYLPMVCAHR